LRPGLANPSCEGQLLELREEEDERQREAMETILKTRTHLRDGTKII
jgi:hypothetical protein